MTIIRQTHGLLVFTYNNSVVRSIKQFDQGHTRKGGGVQFGRSVMSNSLRPHELQHARPPCPSPTPGFHSNSCPLNR